MCQRAYRAPKEVVQKMTELRKCGASYPEIAEQTGYSISTVKRRLKYTDAPTGRGKAKNRISDEKIEQMKKFRNIGMSNGQIALELGIDPHTVIKYIGPQPAMLRAAYGSVCAHVTGESFVSPRTILKK